VRYRNPTANRARQRIELTQGSAIQDADIDPSRDRTIYFPNL
jgi:hypothetical protein